MYTFYYQHVIEIKINSSGKGIYDITDKVRELTKDFSNGLVILNVLDSYSGLITIEYEDRLLVDFMNMINNLPAKLLSTKSTIIQKTLMIPIYNGDLYLGSFQQICFVDLSNKKGIKKIYAMVIKDENNRY